MKIVAFEGQGGPHLGVVEGDQVVDLQAADSKVPTDLGGGWQRTTAIPSRSPTSPSARRRARESRSLGLKYALPVGRPGKIICLGLNYLDHVKEGSQRDNIPKFPTIFYARPHLDGAARPADHPPARSPRRSIMRPS